MKRNQEKIRPILIGNLVQEWVKNLVKIPKKSCRLDNNALVINTSCRENLERIRNETLKKAESLLNQKKDREKEILLDTSKDKKEKAHDPTKVIQHF